jgi:hypothetical protein
MTCVSDATVAPIVLAIILVIFALLWAAFTMGREYEERQEELRRNDAQAAKRTDDRSR